MKESIFACLKEAKNERLLQLLQQTDEYMKDLGAHIQAEQARSAEEQAAEDMRRDLDTGRGWRTRFTQPFEATAACVYS